MLHRRPTPARGVAARGGLGWSDPVVASLPPRPQTATSALAGRRGRRATQPYIEHLVQINVVKGFDITILIIGLQRRFCMLILVVQKGFHIPLPTPGNKKQTAMLISVVFRV